MKKLAVAMIHGIGSQGPKRPADSSDATYSKALQKKLKSELGAARFGHIAVREIFWSDILQGRQETYLASIKRRTRYDDLRAFVLCNLSDASAYRMNAADARDDTYGRIHRRVRDVIAELESDCTPDAPLVVMAH
ncbi:MAG: hypothetical protein AAF829_05680, partial [Pseudomonadota bacterium]